MTPGWIKLHRKIMDNDLWQTKPFSKGQAWIDLLLLANYEEKETLIDGKKVLIERGTFITSIRKLAARWGWSRDKTSRFINALKTDRMLQTKRAGKSTIIEIANYAEYQAFDAVQESKADQSKSQKKTNRRAQNKTKVDTTKEIKKIPTVSKEIKKGEQPSATDKIAFEDDDGFIDIDDDCWMDAKDALEINRGTI